MELKYQMKAGIICIPELWNKELDYSDLKKSLDQGVKKCITYFLWLKIEVNYLEILCCICWAPV